MNDPRGSIWRKWDLQIHTPESHLNNGFGADFDNYFKNLFNKALELEIAVIGITDYFTIEGYKKVRQYLNNNEKLKDLFDDDSGKIEKIRQILILPNIEFRLNFLVDNNRVNFHVIFSDQVSTRDIEENFLHNLFFVNEGNPQNTDDKKKLTIHNLSTLGNRLKQEQVSFSGTDVKIGMMNAVVDSSEICDALNKTPSIFKDKYLLGVPSDEDLSLVDWLDQGHNSRKILIQKSDFLFAANSSTIEWALGKKHIRPDDFRTEFKSLKPCLHGSDAHTYGEIGHPCSARGEQNHDCEANHHDCKLRYCWIKADTTFEGLKQIIYEPESRVKIQQDNPEESETYAKISKLNIDLPDDLKICDKESKDRTDFCISGKAELNFSNNLTCLIGGRGSGKSTLGHLMFSCLGKNKERLEEINSPLLSLELKPAPLKYISGTNKCDGPEQTEFFFQNEIEKTARDLKRMSELITSRLERLSAVNGKNLEELKKTCLNSKSEIMRLLDAYDNIVSIAHEINTKENEVAVLTKQTEVIQSEEYKKYQRELKIISDQISSFELYKNERQELTTKINEIVEYVDKLNWNNEQGIDVINQLKAALTINKQAIKAKFDVYEKAYHDKKLDDLLSTKKVDLSTFLQTKGLSPENIQELTNANQKIAELRSGINALQKKQEPYEIIYKNKANYILAYKESFDNYKTRYSEVSKLLQTKLISLSLSNRNKEITFDLENDTESLTCTIIALIKETLKEESTKENIIRKILFAGVNIENYIENKQTIKEKVETESGAEKHAQLLKELVNEDSFLEKMHLRLIKDFYDIGNIRAQTKLGGKILRNTSFGERCAIVISIIIAAGTNPILIDQPEDNLDGRFITSSLVPLIRSQKHNRQIILITRDANIVIGGDAELINILDENGNKTNTIPSTIENVSNRQKYIWILDGGEEAFKRREQKYNIKKV